METIKSDRRSSQTNTTELRYSCDIGTVADKHYFYSLALETTVALPLSKYRCHFRVKLNCSFRWPISTGRSYCFAPHWFIFYAVCRPLTGRKASRMQFDATGCCVRGWRARASPTCTYRAVYTAAELLCRTTVIPYSCLFFNKIGLPRHVMPRLISIVVRASY